MAFRAVRVGHARPPGFAASCSRAVEWEVTRPLTRFCTLGARPQRTTGLAVPSAAASVVTLSLDDGLNAMAVSNLAAR